MSSTIVLVIFGVISAACAFAAAKLAARQGRNSALWALLTFLLPAVLLILMKFQVEQDRSQS